MSLSSYCVKKRTFTFFATILIVIGGIVSYFFLGQLEDPTYTVKQAAIITQYPGASPKEVEQEVTEKIEIKLQEMPQVKYLKSMSRAGYSQIDYYILPKYHSRKIPQIFDEIRKKVRDAEKDLPPGAGRPVVRDDVSEIYGFVLAVVGDGYTPAELEKYVDDIKRDLSIVEGISRVERWGVQQRTIYVDISQNKLSQLGISPSTLYSTLAQQNLIVDGGDIDLGDERMRIEVTGAFTSPEEISELTFKASPLDRFGKKPQTDPNALVRLGDFATVREGYKEPPEAIMRFDGKPAIGLAISNVQGGNIVHIGAALDKKIDEIIPRLPVGIEFHRVAWQSDLVTESINNFMVSLAQAIIIVLVILWLSMGFANAFIVGTALVMTIVGTFIVMAIWGIDLERMSLGALVIALGMMVDNAIVVVDGANTRIQQGIDKTKAAIESASSTSLPLLGATVIAVSFFYPIYASPEDTGEYCASLFQVVAISLLISWVVSMTITPLQCIAMLKKKEDGKEDEDPYSKGMYRLFKGFLKTCIRVRGLTILAAIALLIFTSSFFGSVPKMFFPDSSRLQFMIDYWLPEGTRIQKVSEDLVAIEEHLTQDPRITGVASFIGQGPPRFYLPVEPERPYPSYAQLIVNVTSLSDLNQLIQELDPYFAENFGGADVRIRKYSVGPGNAFKFEARIMGPGTADPEEIRSIGQEGMAILKATALAKDTRVDWRQRTKKIVSHYSQAKGRWTSVNREETAQATQRFFNGNVVGQYREKDKLIPIIVRATKGERERPSELDTTQVIPQYTDESIPLVQVSDLELEWEDPMIWRRNRRRMITVQSEPNSVTLSQLRAEVVPAFDAIKLPPGYNMEWGAEYESTVDSQQALLPGLYPVVGIVALILVGLFNAYRPPLIIVSVIPFAAIGIVGGLFLTQVPFGFMALLGAMSLAGMMIKNSVVLLDEVNAQLAQGKTQYEAVMSAACSRLRPVILAAATTILGVVPLLKDVFWVSMAVVIMAGLAVGTVLTMVMVPVFYATFFKVKIEN